MNPSNINKETKTDTKQAILDAAEMLFAREGFHCTSLRVITGEAGVNLAAVNYHFGSKEALLEEVFKRRLIPLNEIRTGKLNAVREKADKENRRPGVEEVLRAFIEPTMRLRDTGPGTSDFITLVGRALSEPNDTARKIFIHHIEPLFHLLFDTLQESLPDLSRDILFWRLQFAMGSMSHILRMTGKFGPLLEGITSEDNTERLTEMLVDFVTTGMTASRKE